MADFISINNHSQKGELAISRKVIEKIVDEAVTRVLGSQNPDVKRIKISSPTKITFRNDGTVGIGLTISLKKGVNAEQICLKVQEEIAHDLAIYTESLTFEIIISISDIK